LSESPPEGEPDHELALIEACHSFPCDFALSVIARNEDEVLAAVLAAVTDEARLLSAHDRQHSASAKYVSHRLAVRVGSAAEAHALRARLRAIDGVKTVL
jgi:putative lipoic acid-binding regulatory protein